MKFCELPIDESDLETVAEFLAPHYGCGVGEQKARLITHVRGAFSADFSVEIGGMIAVRINERIRIFLSNHLIKCKNCLSISKYK